MATSKNDVPARLLEERWAHIIEEHPEMDGLRDAVLETINEPERIVQGGTGELIALRETDEGKWLVIVYRELNGDGFIITAFLTRRSQWFERRTQVWP